MNLVVVDTNVWVSAFLNRKGYPSRVKDAWINGKFEVVMSAALLREISEVAAPSPHQREVRPHRR
jgi:putative PIN family toxin of toxin-antitoxin system